MYADTESPLLQILITKLEAKRLCDALPPCEERRRLRNKIAACHRAINFLRANSESARQLLARLPSGLPVAQTSGRHVA